MDTHSLIQFYDDLADDYHCVYADWHASIERQGAALSGLLTRHELPPPARVLDCACGIGTQTLGLARRGYRVHGTDLSPRSVTRASSEAARMGLELTFGVADFRNLGADHQDQYEAVICCDNSLPHLLCDQDIERALSSMRACLVTDGLLVLSIRDYDAVLTNRPNGTPPLSRETESGRQIVFQLWDWAADKPTYTLNLFIMHQTGNGWQTREYTTQYRALRRQELSDLLSHAGFDGVSWALPAETGLFQPVVVARDRHGN